MLNYTLSTTSYTGWLSEISDTCLPSYLAGVCDRAVMHLGNGKFSSDTLHRVDIWPEL
jgi:hypothetical protein